PTEEDESVGAACLRCLKRQRLRRVPACAHAGNTHAAGEVAISQNHPPAPGTALLQLFEMKAPLQPHPPLPSAHPPPPPPPPRPSRGPPPPRPRSRSLPAGSHTARTGPAPRNWMVPMTEPSP